MQCKNIEISVLLFVSAVIFKPVIQILAIMHTVLIINSMVKDGLDMLMTI